MDNNTKLKLLKVKTDEVDEAVLTAFLEEAKLIIMNRLYPFGNGTELPEKYDGLQVRIATYHLNKRGAEGEISHSENGITRAYASGDTPQEMLREIVPYIEVVK